MDWTIASILVGNGLCDKERIEPGPGEYVIIDTDLPIITAHRTMFLGTVGLDRLGYQDLHAFAKRAVEILAAEGIAVPRLTSPVHGPGFGLDAAEAVQHLAVGFLDGARTYKPAALGEITFVERNARRIPQMLAALQDIGLMTPSREPGCSGGSAPGRRAKALPESPAITLEKRDHVFVAIPFAEAFQDVYEFGIYAPVRNCGYICERVDETSFTGDVLHRIRSRVESAQFVIADLTEARPNVYLEVGYAWGREVPVIFVAREGEPLHFDVKTHKCIYYRTIGQLARDLEKLIRGLTDHRAPQSL